eukprot:Protomagalhaensia_sp_Gyna_25__1485@NODE_175_length_4616_cov_11_232685_g137_i0_p2_GENE_NODE_175_length_4616_cov_11_232685_g137_i0NODE_175_length_4616_cov_11_232685_g137_i0_p2_ORF_typecomplete_len517_score49_73_NODE_175_length_4616_cov_11_232685_g137_i06172167
MRTKTDRAHQQQWQDTMQRHKHFLTHCSPISSNSSDEDFWTKGLSPLTDDDTDNTTLWSPFYHRADSRRTTSLSQISSNSHDTDRSFGKPSSSMETQSVIQDQAFDPPRVVMRRSQIYGGGLIVGGGEDEDFTKVSSVRVETPTTEPETSAESGGHQQSADHILLSPHQLLPTRLLCTNRDGLDVPVLQLLICWCCRLQDEEEDEDSRSDLSGWRHQAIQAQSWNTFRDTRMDSWREVVDLEKTRDDSNPHPLLWLNPAEFALQDSGDDLDTLSTFVESDSQGYAAVTSRLNAQNQLILEPLSKQEEKCLSCNRSVPLPVFICQDPAVCQAFSDTRTKRLQHHHHLNSLMARDQRRIVTNDILLDCTTNTNTTADIPSKVFGGIHSPIDTNTAAATTTCDSPRSRCPPINHVQYHHHQQPATSQQQPHQGYRKDGRRRGRGGNQWRGRKNKRRPLNKRGDHSNLMSTNPMHPVIGGSNSNHFSPRSTFYPIRHFPSYHHHHQDSELLRDPFGLDVV